MICMIEFEDIPGKEDDQSAGSKSLCLKLRECVVSGKREFSAYTSQWAGMHRFLM